MRWGLCLALLVGCGDEAEPTTTQESDGGTPELSAFALQVERGKELYADHCASCHGSTGEGGEGPRLVGLSQGALLRAPREESLRTSTFSTVADVASFVVQAMPSGRPGSLEDDEYWAILAFNASQNGIELDEELTPAIAATLSLPR